MRRLLIVLIWASPMWATAFTSSQSGHWNTNSTWGGAGHPSTSSDTATISGGFTVTVDNTDGTVTTGAVTISSGANHLTIGNGSVFNLNGNMTVNAGGASLNCTPTTSPATITIVVPTATTFAIQSGGTGSGNVVFNFSGASTTNTCTVVGSVTGTGVAQVNLGGWGNGVNLTTNFAVFRSLGNATTTGWTIPPSGASLWPSISNTLWDRNGLVSFVFSGATTGGTWNGMDFRRCLDSNNNFCMQVTGSAASAGTPRLILNMTGGDNGTSLAPQAVAISMIGIQVGQDTVYGDASTVPGFYAYNVALNMSTGTTNSSICRMCFIVSDQNTTSNNLITASGGFGLKFQDIYLLDQSQNQHEIGITNPAFVSSNLYQGVISDGNGMVWADTGNIYGGGNNDIVKDNLCINEAGEWSTYTNTTTSFAWLNNTSYECRGVDATLTSVHSTTTTTAFRNQLIVYPGWSGPVTYDINGYGKDDPVYDRQTTLSLDYNTFWMTPGSGDSIKIPGATLNAQASCPQSCAIPNNGISSAIPGYIQANGVDTPLQASTVTTAGTTTTNVACSTCLFTTNGMQAGDYICDFVTSGGGTQPYKCDAVQTVNSNTQITLKNGISTLATGHFIVGYVGYMATASQFYGITSGYGTHDVHINPQFVDASRNACTWYNLVSGTTSECAGFQTGNIPNTFGMIFTSTAGTGTTTVKCSACDFVTWGISTHSVVQAFSTTTTTIRGLATVTNVGDLHTLTISPAITGFASGDVFTFVTATQGIGRGILTLNGWDYGSSSGTPVAVTPAAWATLPNILTYIRTGFTPMNGQLKNAAKPSDCSTNDPLLCDIGGIPVYSAAAMAIL